MTPDPYDPVNTDAGLNQGSLDVSDPPAFGTARDVTDRFHGMPRAGDVGAR